MATFFQQSATMMPSTSSLLSWYASYSASLMLFRNTYKQVVPEWIQTYVASKLSALWSRKKVDPSYGTFIIDDWDCSDKNEIIDAVEYYLSSKIGPDDHQVIRVAKFDLDDTKSVVKGLVEDQEIVDEFEHMEVTWKLVNPEKKNGDDDKNKESSSRRKKLYFELRFEDKYRERIKKDYLENHVLSVYNAYLEGKRELRLHTRKNFRNWFSMDFKHPCTFDTLAMDHELKESIIDDLDRFLTRKDFYRKVGKAWKRGYLLYGPPGTGKSSLIAAMANYLRFDVYDFQLGSITSDVELRKALLYTEDRSIIVIEDIDCNAEVHSRSDSKKKKSKYRSSFKLSSLLNCIDGLWSSCGEERIIVFTTNHKEVIDPALLRPGRMDMHIHMSYCTVQGFRILASNYLGVKEHQLFEEIDGLIQGAEVTPASLAEELMKSDDPDVALGEVVNFLKEKKLEREQKGKTSEAEHEKTDEQSTSEKRSKTSESENEKSDEKSASEEKSTIDSESE